MPEIFPCKSRHIHGGKGISRCGWFVTLGSFTSFTKRSTDSMLENTLMPSLCAQCTPAQAKPPCFWIQVCTETYSHRHLNHHTPTISHQSHLQQPETLLWIQLEFSSPLCITATSPKHCSSAWLIWAHFVQINTKQGNPPGWLNNKKFGSRTPSHLCAQLILHHAPATFILFCQKVRSRFHHEYLELENCSKTNFSWVQRALQERR